MQSWEEIRREVLRIVKPSKEEEVRLLDFAEETIEKINKVLRESGVNASAELHGSVAHGTWISGQQDVDIFLVIEDYSGREQLAEALEAVKNGTLWNFTEAYAEHPYLKTEINGWSLDIVPCFRVGVNESLHSSTDRTPLHTMWLRERLDDLGDDVLILKRFLKTLDLYGAEIRIGGFSGYLCELLVIYYGGFLELIKAASSWGKREVIGFNHETREFDEPLTVYDPVDKERNVASALREESYSMFIAAARSFSEKPDLRFFKREEIDVSRDLILGEIENRPTDLLFLVIEESSADIADVLWGQIHKSKQAIERVMRERGFNPLRTTAWSNEETRHIFIFELETGSIPETVRHLGPPAHLEQNVRKFIETYRDNPRTVSGPDLLGDRWFVLVKRDYTEIRDLMGHLLGDGGRSIGVSRKLAVRILQHHRVLLNAEIANYLSDGFDVFLYDWLKGRPLWIE